MAAQLMAAGANQQLIAAKLEEAHEIGPDKPESNDSSDDSNDSDGTVEMNEGESNQLSKEPAEKKKSGADGELAINHEKEGDLDEVAKQTAAEQQQEATKTAEQELAEQLSQVAPVAASATPTAELKEDLAAASLEEDKPTESVLPAVQVQTPDADAPSMGGTLNATTEQAQHDKQAAIDDDRNKTILSHGGSKYIGDSQPTYQAPFSAATDDSDQSEPDVVDIFSQPTQPTEPAADIAPAASQEAPQFSAPSETLEDIDRQNRQSAPEENHEEARSAVELAYEATPLPTLPPMPAPTPESAVDQAFAQQAEPVSPAPFASPDVALPPPPAAPADFSQLPPPPPLPTFAAPQGPLPPEQLGQIFATPPAPTDVPPAPAPDPNDPNQFKIPGQ